MQEFPLFPKQWKKGINTVDIVYPNKYYGGVYSLGPLILYNIINKRENWLCNRVFLDHGEIKSSLVGFTLQYELDYYNFLAMLKKAKISLDKEKREQLIFAGGPCANSNPFTLSRYVDFFILGDCEETIQKVLDAYEHKNGKKEFLNEIAKIKGVFVPGISEYDEPSFVESLDSVDYPLYQPFPEKVDKSFVFGKVFMLEIERGCPFSCKFCLMPAFYRKVEYRSIEKLKEIIDQGIALNKRKKVITYSPSFTHPKGKEVLKYLLEKGLEFSVPSIKVEVADEEMLKLVRQGGQKTVTVAPEANQEVRYSLGKIVSDEKFFNFAEMASKIGFEGIKYYFMIGIPGQEKKDLEEMVLFIKKLKSIFPKTYISINPFVPKPKAAFGGHPFDKKAVKEHASFLRKELGKLGIRFKLSGISNSIKEWKLANAKNF